MHEPISLRPAIEAGVRAGALGSLGLPWAERIATSGILTELAEGRVQPAWHVAPTIVIGGFLRIRARTDVGREWTLRYLEPGDTAHFSFHAPDGLQLQALADSTLLVLGRERIRNWMAQDARFASGVAAAIAAEHEAVLAEVTGTALRPLRIRVCNHLLFLAARAPHLGGRVELTHQDLACAVGSVRDVVTRILDELQSLGVIELRRGAIVVRDHEGLRVMRDAWGAGPATSAVRGLVTSVT